MKNKENRRMLDQLVQFSRKSAPFDIETQRCEEIWKGLSKDEDAFDDVLSLARREPDDFMPSEQQMAIVLAQLVVNILVIRGIDAKKCVDSVLPDQSVDDSMTAEELQFQFDAPPYEKPEE